MEMELTGYCGWITSEERLNVRPRGRDKVHADEELGEAAAEGEGRGEGDGNDGSCG